MMRLVGEVEMQNGLVPHTHEVVKIRRDILGVEVPPEEGGVPVPHQAPQHRVLVPRREAPPRTAHHTPPPTSKYESSGDFTVTKGCWSHRIPLKASEYGLSN